MKIKMYVVTYNNNSILNDWFLNSLYNSVPNYPAKDVQVYIIDNHSNIKIEEKYKPLVTILSNQLRPDFSTGHLSRNWNQAIINGFESLTNPVCNAVACVQNDTILNPNWYNNCVTALKKWEFVTQGAGDQFQLFTAEAIKNIGIYDERFCGIGFQEFDFFLRALLLFASKSCITDEPHKRLLNPENFNIIQQTIAGAFRQETSHTNSSKIAHPVCKKMAQTKWKKELFFNSSNTVNENCPTYTLYPYFEKDIYPATKQFLNYVT